MLALLLVVDRENFVDQVVFVNLVALAFPDFSIVDVQVPQALPQGGVEKVLYSVVGAVAGQFFRNGGPLFSVESDEVEQKLKIYILEIFCFAHGGL